MPELTSNDYLKLAAEACVDPRTAKAAYEGRRMLRTAWNAIRDAAQKLDLPAPAKWCAPGSVVRGGAA